MTQDIHEIDHETEEEIIEKHTRAERRANISGRMAVIAGIVFLFICYWWISSLPRQYLDAAQAIKDGYKETGTIGDTFGGLMSPPIAFIGALLTFIAFYIQFVANRQQKNQFNLSLKLQRLQYARDLKDREREKQELIISKKREAKELHEKEHKERVESRFFELLKLHKANVSEIYLAPGITGRRCFSSMFYEFKSIYDNVVEVQTKLNVGRSIAYSDVDPTAMAYNIFFYGIGNNSRRNYFSEFTDEEKEIFSYKPFDIWQGNTIYGVKANLSAWKKSVMNHTTPAGEVIYKKEDVNWPIRFHYTPYIGHANWLGHYYRHLYQTAKYILDDTILTTEEKKQYLRTLRAQLSNFEQLMLFYNAIVWFPEEWKQLFIDYKFIKNIPIELALAGPKPTEVYEKEMIALWKRGDKEKLFERQGDITALVMLREREALAAIPD